jgi:hypothetical protein
MTSDREGEPAEHEPARPKRRGQSVGMTIGGILAGVDGQIFRSTPPAAELVQSARPVRGVSGEDGTFISIDLAEIDAPGAEPPDAAEADIG